METKIRKWTVLIICLICLLALTSCPNPFVEAVRPTNQENTRWESEDGRIVFTVDENKYTTGVIRMEDDSVVEIYVVEPIGIGNTIFICPIDDIEKIYEWWSCEYKSRKEFTVTVDQTTFFEVGQTIIFHRVEE